uniref:Putative secreted protein n=1 Tax=Ixodes ricinus TaxID=34613 RepID=A0A147BES0_IXORI
MVLAALVSFSAFSLSYKSGSYHITLTPFGIVVYIELHDGWVYLERISPPLLDGIDILCTPSQHPRNVGMFRGRRRTVRAVGLSFQLKPFYWPRKHVPGLHI